MPLSSFDGVLLRGPVFKNLNFQNGRGTISFSANWQMAIRGVVLFAAILFQARVMSGRTERKVQT